MSVSYDCNIPAIGSVEAIIADEDEIMHLLPVFHNTNVAGIKYALDTKSIAPRPQRADQVVYLAYGKPRYIRRKKPDDLDNYQTNLNGVTLCSFVFLDAAWLTMTRLYPFDSGYFLTGRLESDLEIVTTRTSFDARSYWGSNQLAFSPSVANFKRFISKFWGNNDAYVTGRRKDKDQAPDSDLESGCQFVDHILTKAASHPFDKNDLIREAVETVEVHCTALDASILKRAIVYIPVDLEEPYGDKVRELVAEVIPYVRPGGGASARSDYRDLVDAMGAEGLFDNPSVMSMAQQE